MECTSLSCRAAFINTFSVDASHTGAAEFTVTCDCCGSSIGAELGNNFLNHFRWQHLFRPRHKANAQLRFKVLMACLRDSALAATAAASTATGAITFQSSDVAAIQRLAQSASEAAERAAEAARSAEAGVRASVSLLRDTPLADPLQPSELERLVASTPGLVWTVSDDGARSTIQCDWCRRDPFKSTSEADLLHNINTHLTSAAHEKAAQQIRLYGNRLLPGGFFGPMRAGPAPPPAEPPDRSHLCNGNYNVLSMQVDGQALDVSELLYHEPTDASGWYPDRFLRRTIKLSGGRGRPDREVVIRGSFRSTRCTGFSLDAAGKPLPGGVCDACRLLPKLDTFRKLATRHAKAAASSRDESRVRFDLLSHERRLGVMRALAAKVRQLKSTVFLLRQSYTRKCARVRKLTERLKEFAFRGDVKAIVDDVIAIEKAGKFEQRAGLLNMVRDMLHSLRLRDGAEGTHSKGMRWHQSTKRIFAVLRKYGGAKVHRFLHETLEAPDEGTVRREWRKDRVRFKPGAHRHVFAAIGRLYAAMKLAKGITEPVPYELSEDDSTVPGASEFNQHWDSIVGYCGKRGPGHRCDPCCNIIIGDGKQ